jgi:hypothetical protein
MLLDMVQDPGEMTNIAGEPAMAGELQRHRRLLQEWNKITDEEKYPAKSAPKAARKKAKRQK